MAETLPTELPAELRNVLSTDQAWHYRVIPKSADGGRCVLYCGTDVHDTLRFELEVLLGRDVELEAASPEAVDRALGMHYRRTGETTRRVDLAERSSEHVLHDLVQEARSLGSSDIHIEVFDHSARVRIRIDGLLVERYRYDKADHPGLVNRVKVTAGLDISEKRLPQDGRMVLDRDGLRSDIRVSILPTLHGEKVVLRLLGQDAGELRIEKLGLDERQLADYVQGVQRPHGMVLISGPTGSGKTTTLYATLKRLNEVRRNVVTVEDPVEYTLEGINQVQLREHIGLTFAQALRTFLRQDPDVIMLGEIRDAETAQMAIRASLTGHLVLSTIHTNSAWGTISRLVDMGIPPFLIAATLNTSVAQRLVRLLCIHCKRSAPCTDPAVLASLPEPLESVSTAVGCAECHYTGYKGRYAVYEVIPMDHELAQLLRSGAPQADELLARKGIRTLRSSAFELLREGRTSLEEAHPILTTH